MGELGNWSFTPSQNIGNSNFKENCFDVQIKEEHDGRIRKSSKLKVDFEILVTKRCSRMRNSKIMVKQGSANHGLWSDSLVFFFK